MNTNTNSKNTGPRRGRGRPRTSGNFRIVPVPVAQPDPRKLGRALLALALHDAEQQEHGNDVEAQEVDGERA